MKCQQKERKGGRKVYFALFYVMFGGRVLTLKHMAF